MKCWCGALPVFALVLVSALTMASCKGDRGSEGIVLIETTWTADVLSIDASSLGIVSSGAHPDPGTAQPLTETNASVTWSSNWLGGITNYTASVALEVVSAQEGKRGLLPKLIVELPGLTVQDGNDGLDQNLRFHFENDQLRVYFSSSPLTGTPVVAP